MGIALIAALLACGCGDTADKDEAPRPPDVVLVVIDTLRADRLSCYGYGRPTTPFLDQLAEQGTLFEDHTCQFAWTVPSMVSLVTGRYMPREHHSVLPDATTIAEAFRGAGYRTIGVVANELLHESSGFDRGFDHYDVTQFREDETEVRRIRQLSADLWGPLGEVLATDAEGRRPPVFLYVHAIDPHDPYQAWPALDGELPVAGATPLSPKGWHDGRLDAAGNDRGAAERAVALARIARERGRYDQELRMFDDGLRETFARLGELGLLEHALVAVCADHGEGLWEHETPRTGHFRRNAKVGRFFYQFHGRTLHAEIIATPWILWGREVPTGLRVQRGTENVDVFPTLLELCGIPLPPGPLHGRSVVPLLRGGAPEWKRYVFSAAARGRGSVREVATGLKLSLRRGGLVGSEMSPPELYDLRADPLERENLSSARPADVERLRAVLLEWAAAHALPEELGAGGPSLDFLERLRELGYTSEDTGFGE